MAARGKTQIDEIANEAIRRIREEAERSMHAIEAQTDRPRRGPMPGRGGRPRKGSERRETKAVSLDPSVISWIESQRRPEESFSEVVERLFRRQMES